MSEQRITERDRLACLLAGIADVNAATAARFLNGDPIQRKQREALERAQEVAREKHPEIIGGGA